MEGQALPPGASGALYEGQATLGEMDAHLVAHGFAREACRVNSCVAFEYGCVYRSRLLAPRLSDAALGLDTLYGDLLHRAFSPGINPPGLRDISSLGGF